MGGSSTSMLVLKSVYSEVPDGAFKHLISWSTCACLCTKISYNLACYWQLMKHQVYNKEIFSNSRHFFIMIFIMKKYWMCCWFWVKFVSWLIVELLIRKNLKNPGFNCLKPGSQYSIRNWHHKHREHHGQKNFGLSNSIHVVNFQQSNWVDTF